MSVQSLRLTPQERRALDQAPRKTTAGGGYPTAEQSRFRDTVRDISKENAWMAIPALAPVLAPIAAQSTVAAGMMAKYGGEIAFGKDFRLAPFGNRTRIPVGRAPHYHRRGGPPNERGEAPPGQGIGRHRPWETKSPDKSFWDRF